MLKRPDQRVAVLIDTQNMYHSAKNIYNAKVNFGALIDAAVGPRQMVRSIAYVAKSKGGEETSFFEALQNIGIELKIKDVQEFSSGAKKADWDVGMAIDAVALAPRVDAIVLVTGDGDFVPLVEYLQTHGVACECVAFGESTNATLKERVNEFTNLSEDPGAVLIGYRGKAKNEPAKQEQKPETKQEVKAPEAKPVVTLETKPVIQVIAEPKQDFRPLPLQPVKDKDLNRSNAILHAITPANQSPHFVSNKQAPAAKATPKAEENKKPSTPPQKPKAKKK
ncbi:MAG: NYN domain-containing protein [Candidatus Magasanikbacteria bacterium]|nr:NYN domain-containing protein [Candidatus Magasanikbacteria bacterium]MCA9391093.1 NYN domain-containing protein [Candidatus Magasanikbacteria bacterium]USN52408.1 MAG: NYN domain-containing protein [Candidatus Nomurabacteria bacterium]